MKASFPGLVGYVIGKVYADRIDDIGMVIGWSGDNIIVVEDGGRLVSVQWESNIAVTGKGQMLDCNDPDGTT